MPSRKSTPMTINCCRVEMTASARKNNAADDQRHARQPTGPQFLGQQDVG